MEPALLYGIKNKWTGSLGTEKNFYAICDPWKVSTKNRSLQSSPDWSGYVAWSAGIRSRAQHLNGKRDQKYPRVLMFCFSKINVNYF